MAAGPWFTVRVMAAIEARQAELEERREGVWTYVGRLAPRLVAVAAALLIIGGTWLAEQRRIDTARVNQMRGAESVFEAAQSAPIPDDVVASVQEGHSR